MKVAIVNGVARQSRKPRKPSFPYQVRLRPWALTPFHISPVLPGETMKNLKHLGRVVSDPLNSKLAGWWCERYYFYVKHSDLPQKTEVRNMHLTGSALTTNRVTAANADTYTFDNGIDWLTPCIQRITEEYFRDEGETWNTNLIGAYPAVQVQPDGWWGDSLVDDSVAVPTENVLQDGAKEDDTIWSAYTAQFERMRQMRQTNLTWDDWLAMHGVEAPTDVNEDLYKPELLKWTREFTLPSNTVEPTTGVPTSAAIWTVQDRVDKDYRFKEPGFLVGLMCVRPKVFRSNQKGLAIGALDEARLWLPSLMRDEAYTSIKKFENTDVSGEGPLGTTPTNDYWADMRDLFIYGDQFYNFDITAAGDKHANPVALPTAALVDRYATATMADALFAGASPANLFRCDGVVQTDILSYVGEDQT